MMQWQSAVHIGTQPAGAVRDDRRTRAPTSDYLNGQDIAALALTDDEILAAVEGGRCSRRAAARP